MQQTLVIAIHLWIVYVVWYLLLCYFLRCSSCCDLQQNLASWSYYIHFRIVHGLSGSPVQLSILLSRDQPISSVTVTNDLGNAFRLAACQWDLQKDCFWKPIWFFIYYLILVNAYAPTVSDFIQQARWRAQSSRESFHVSGRVTTIDAFPINSYWRQDMWLKDVQSCLPPLMICRDSGPLSNKARCLKNLLRFFLLRVSCESCHCVQLRPVLPMYRPNICNYHFRLTARHGRHFGDRIMTFCAS